MSLFTGGIAIASALAATGGSVLAASKVSGASKNAAQINADSTAKALDYTKTKDAQDRADTLAADKANYAQYVQSEGQKAPYRAAGQGATQTISHLLGLPDVTIAPPPPAPAYLSPSTSTSAPQGTGLVTLRAPNGQTKQVPQAQADYYLSKGAQKVG